MNTETVMKETDTTGLYYRRTVRDNNGTVVSDERVKRDPVLHFTPPSSLTLDSTTGTAAVAVSFQLRDFDARTDAGTIHFRIYDRAVADEEGVPFTRQLVDGALTLSLEFDAPGDYLIVVEPPLVADVQLSEPLRLTVR